MDCSRQPHFSGTRSAALVGILLISATGCPSDDVTVSEDGSTSTTDATSTTEVSTSSSSTSTSGSSSSSGSSTDASGSSSSGVAETSTGPDTITTDPTSSTTDVTSSTTGTTGDSSSSTAAASSSSSTSGEMMESCPFGTLEVPDTVPNSTAATADEFTSSCGGGGAPDVSYVFTAPFDGVFVFDTFGSAIDTILHVKSGTCGGPELACNDNFELSDQSQVSVALTMGQTVTVVVDGFSLMGGAVVLNSAGFEGVCPDADIGNTVPQTQSGSTAAGDNTLFGSCGGNQAADDAYTFTAPSPGIYTIDTEGSDFDTVLAVFDSCGGDELGCSDNFGGPTSRLDVTLGAGEQILIVVDGAGTEEGNYDLNINLDACPDFDLGNTVPNSVSGSTAGLIDANEVTCAPSTAPDASYTFTAPSDGTYVFDTFGSDFDTVLSVFDGAICGSDTSLACNDQTGGNQSQVDVALTAGQTVTVVVDGYLGNTGNYVLNVFTPNCGNDIAEPFEECDGADLGGETCGTQGFPGGTLACDAACAFDLSGCNSCGDDVVNGADACDGTGLGMMTCEDLGFAGGSLDCEVDCAAFDTSECSNTVITVCDSPGAVISTAAPVLSTVNVAAMGTIADVDVFVDITHTWNSDVDVSLLADDLALSNNISHDNCGSADDYWAFFNDEGNAAAGAECAVPFAIEGNVTPDQPLSVYDGNEASGSWTLEVVDDLGGFDGVLNSWCLYITLE